MNKLITSRTIAPLALGAALICSTASAEVADRGDHQKDEAIQDAVNTPGAPAPTDDQQPKVAIWFPPSYCPGGFYIWGYCFMV